MWGCADRTQSVPRCFRRSRPCALPLAPRRCGSSTAGQRSPYADGQPDVVRSTARRVCRTPGMTQTALRPKTTSRACRTYLITSSCCTWLQRSMPCLTDECRDRWCSLMSASGIWKWRTNRPVPAAACGLGLQGATGSVLAPVAVAEAKSRSLARRSKSHGLGLWRRTCSWRCIRWTIPTERRTA